MAADGSIVIDVSVDTEALGAELAELGRTVSQGAKEAGDGLKSAIAGSVEGARLAGFDAASGGGFSYIGSMLAEGLAGGVKSAAAQAVQAARDMIESVKSVIKTGVEVQSPSKWARGVGAFIGEGLAEGVAGSAIVVAQAAESMVSSLRSTVEREARNVAGTEIAAIDAVIEAEKAALKERSRIRELEQRQHAVELAVDADVKRRAIEYLSDTERRFELEDLEEYRRVLAEREKALEKHVEEQVRAVKDVSYETREYAYGDTEIKLKLWDEEYLARVKAIDDELYAFLSAKNTEMEAVIERIALEDSATAERLAALLKEKNEILEKSRIEKEAREERTRADKEDELLRRIWDAETFEERIKRQSEYDKWREDEEYRIAEKGRQAKVSALDSEYKEIIDTVKKAQKEIDALRQEGEDAAQKAAEELKTGGGQPIDLDADKERIELSEAQQKEYIANTLANTQQYYDERKALLEREAENEYAFLRGFNDSLTELLLSYSPRWYEIGGKLMVNLYDGLMSRYNEVAALVSRIRSQLDSISYGSGAGGSLPMYGEGGVVTTPRVAVVGDKPEAIIPLAQLDRIIKTAAFTVVPSIVPAAGESEVAAVVTKNITVNQTNNINQPVKSPAETARELRKLSRALAAEY